MRKKIFMFSLLFILTAVQLQAQTMWFRTTAFASKIVGSDWTDWQQSNMKVKIDLQEESIVIYSPETQVYVVLRELDPPVDKTGTTVKFLVLDQDYNRGAIRLRIENNGNSQLYVDYADMSWVYNVVRIE